MAFHKVCDDDPAGITAAILEAKAAGCELIFTTGGMSVDPDDRTPLAIRNTGDVYKRQAVDKGMELGEIHLVEKTGGKSGHYIRAEGGYV